MARNEKPKSGSLIPVLTVLGGLILLVVGAAVLAGRAGLLMMLVFAAVLAIPVLHYITWGWWLSKTLGQAPPEDEASDSADDE